MLTTADPNKSAQACRLQVGMYAQTEESDVLELASSFMIKPVSLDQVPMAAMGRLSPIAEISASKHIALMLYPTGQTEVCLTMLHKQAAS